MSYERDVLLKMTDEELLNRCKTDHYIATGNGGQKRNKTSSAVRLTLKDTSISATASEDRQQSVNKKRALRKLRLAIAMEMRQEAQQWQGQLDMNPKNAQYPLFIAALTDNLFDKNWQVSEVAKSMDLSTGKLIKIIAKDDTLWQFVNKERQKNDYKPLKK
ncbi:peptide chain release factor-like protein [Lentisphaera profundi]|uniref:Peptide chain release factor-like protein n=1 Tax=Lentisphaera profundi TaxID=1658616 RepID=A0ABY7VRW0_9BACT|nr:peptide chain release factor-like protein [Lentisphaera profundi]WDE96948.1 peptide chain release factor-like protein [Lentisphaera profundi]